MKLSTIYIQYKLSLRSKILENLKQIAGLDEDPAEKDSIINSPLQGYRSVEEDIRREVSKADKSLFARKWSGLDNRFFKPLLTHSNPTLLDTLPTRCLPLGRLFTSSEQLSRHPLFTRDQSQDSDSLPFNQVPWDSLPFNQVPWDSLPFNQVKRSSSSLQEYLFSNFSFCFRSRTRRMKAFHRKRRNRNPE